MGARVHVVSYLVFSLPQSFLSLFRELYLTSASHISSRAFPSTLLSQNPSLLSSPSTEPILLPGIDSLNHARGQPVSWVVTYPNELNQTPEPCVSLILHSPTPASSELFNNYGAKPNSELILGYGFSLAENPDDTIILKIGGGGSNTKKWEIGRSLRGAEGLWTEVLSLISQDTTYNYEDELDASSTLGEMIRAVIEKLPTSKRSLDPGQIRPDVIEMFRNYLEGENGYYSRYSPDLSRAICRPTGHSRLPSCVC